ncbi:MAG TPA: ABC transporter permease, partial [Actinobacteria bacterium]|nr:ABC transporter permease [Actinomycetota bacterium]
LNYKEIFIALIIFIALYFFVPNFYSYENFFSIVTQISILSFFAFAVTFPGLIKEFDLSVGATAGLSSTLIAVLVNNNMGLPQAILIGVAVALVCGLLNGFLVIDIGISAIIVTIGTGFVFNAFELILNGGRRVVAPMAMTALTTKSFGPIPIYFIFGFFMVLVLYFFSLWTTMGRSIYATGENKTAAKFSGIKVRMYGYMCFVGAAFLAALGGIFAVSHSGTAQVQGGDKFLWDSFIAYFIGVSFFRGKRLFVGTYVGVIFTVIIGQVMILVGVEFYYVQLFRAIILVLAIIISTPISLRRRIKRA